MARKTKMNLNSLTLLLICSWITVPIVQSIPISRFYPFGNSHGDTKLPKNDDSSSGVIDISISFPYFDRNHDKLYVNTNGVISFLGSVSQYTPVPFPLGDNRRLLTAFWADVDTRKGGDVWYRETTDQNLLQRVAIDIKRALIKFSSFTPTWLYIATWDKVAFFGSNATNNHKRNTFQAILVTNGRHSFVIYNYARLEWLSGTASHGIPAQCGFNAGDGKKFFSIQGSRTKDVLKLTRTSNVHRPGVWMFQVDTADIHSEGCNTAGRLTISPRQTLMLGGENIYIAGPCFSKNDDKMVCNFGDKQKVPGSYIDEVKAKCVAPMISETGRIQLKVSLDDGKTFPFQGFFHYVTVIRKKPLVIRSPQIEWVEGKKAGIQWDAKKLGDKSRPVNIEMANYKMKSGQIQLDGFVSISTQNNTGTSTITLPTEGADDISKGSSDRSVSLVRVSKNTADGSSDESPNEWIWSDVFSLINSSKALARCKYWQQHEPDAKIFKDDDTLLPCPQSLLQALVDRGNYIADEFCNGKNRDACKMYHPKATHCVRTITPSSKGAGQQCCYNTDGNLIDSKPGAGHLHRAHIDTGIPYISHYYHDILPYHECCLLSRDCDNYFRKRPNDDGSNYEPPTAASGVGDPHMVTLDGVEYTFNGYGEYTLLKVAPIGFDLQGRMEPLARNGKQINATVYTAFAMRENGSDTIEIRLNGRGFLDVFVNGQLEDFDDEQTVDFKNVMIIKEGNNTKYSAIFHSGIAVITEGFTNLLQFTVMMPKHFKRNTSGLLGYWDDNKEQEFLLPNGLFLNASSNSKTLHYEFGLKWATQAHETLFTYEQGKSHQTYSKPNFLPVFVDLNNMVFDDPVLERKARSTCGSSIQCLFDVQATGDTNIGLATKNSIQQLQAIINITETKGCVPLDSNFTNGFYQRNDSEGSITYRYRCAPGFILNGSSIVSCFQGQWNGTVPNCLKACVPLDSNFTNGFYQRNDSEGSITYRYRCAPGFILNGSSIVSCFQGQWNGTVPNCVPVKVVKCPSVEMKIPHGRALSHGRLPTSGSEVFFECVEGYDLVGVQSIVCRQNGTWSGESPYCRKRCPKVTIANGNTTYNETEHHVVAHFTCIKGYTLIGAQQILCTKSNGTWAAAPPSCQLASGDVEHHVDSKGDKTKAISIGVTLSVLIVLTLSILVIYLLVKRKSSNPKTPEPETFNMESKATLLTKDDRKMKVKVIYI